MIFFELIPSTNRGGLLAELHRFQSIQLRAGIALTFWNLERWLSGTILVLFYIPKLKNAIFCYKNISLVIDSNYKSREFVLECIQMIGLPANTKSID